MNRINKNLSLNERGMASTVVLAGVVPLILATGAMLSTVGSYHNELGDWEGMQVARTISQTGAQDALAQLDVDSNFEGKYRLFLNGGVAVVSVSDWMFDGVDNDGDGIVDGASEKGLLGIQSTGYLNAVLDGNMEPLDNGVRRFESSTFAVAERLTFDLDIEQAIYVDDPFADLNISGNAFTFSGIDTNPDGTAAPGDPKPAMGVPGDPQFLIDQIAANQEDNIIGEGGIPSILTAPLVDIGVQLDSMSGSADVTFPAGSSHTGQLGTAVHPLVAHCPGNFTLHGGVDGNGVLIVEGDLTVNGGLDYQGLVFVGGSVTFNGGGGKNVYGGLVCLGAVAANIEIMLNGSVAIYYSSMAIENVKPIMNSGFRLKSWVQK